MIAKNRTLLYVDDEENNLTGFRAVFRKDYDIMLAKSASEAMVLLKENDVQIVVSDQRMPNVSGVEFLEKLSHEYPSIIRIIITGFSDYNAIVDSINKAKVYKYLPKPWKKEEFKEILDKAFELYELRTQNKILVGELTKVNEELDHFLYSASHDLRAPIATIKGLIELAKRETDVTVIQDLIGKKERTINRLDFFVTQINQYAGNLRMSDEFNEVWFDPLIDEVLVSLRTHDRYACCKINRAIDQSAVFTTDRRRLLDAFFHVLLNAFNFYHRERETVIDISVRIENNNALIRVVDNGVGIHKDEIPKVFNMFYKASSFNSGAGLGLFLTRETIRKIEGNITIESELGKQTVVTITIPDWTGRTKKP